MSLIRLFYLLNALALGSSAAPAVNDASNFNLFAYGGSMGGLPIFFADGNAQLGNAAASNASSVSYVQFTKNSSSPNQLIANPNATANHIANVPASNTSWSNMQLFVPMADNSNQQVGFVSKPGSDQMAARFLIYGGNVMVNDGSGNMDSCFFAQPSGTDGVWSLLWNMTRSQASAASAFPVALRNVEPSPKRND